MFRVVEPSLRVSRSLESVAADERTSPGTPRSCSGRRTEGTARTVAEGRDAARPLACFFAIEQALERAAPDFEREFGALPRLRAALHAGPVITGEVGGSRRAIVYHGDVMNTTSRIEQATRDLECKFLVSADALTRLEDLEGFVLDDLGLQQLRGRAAAMRVYAVTAKASLNGRKPV